MCVLVVKAKNFSSFAVKTIIQQGVSKVSYRGRGTGLVHNSYNLLRVAVAKRGTGWIFFFFGLGSLMLAVNNSMCAWGCKSSLFF